jgi:SAM-dependent methyltransferase
MARKTVAAPTKSRTMIPQSWLVHRIHDAALADALRNYARGVLVDIGCGEKPYSSMTEGLVDSHYGLDYPGSKHSSQMVDLFATARATALRSNSVDTILCTFVLEHLSEPACALAEMYRILAPQGHILLSAPQFWHTHEAPRDYYRYTQYGIEYLMSQAGFTVLSVIPLSGFVVTFAQELVYYLIGMTHPKLRFMTRMLCWALQRFAYPLSYIDRTQRFAWAHLAIARKDERD